MFVNNKKIFLVLIVLAVCILKVNAQSRFTSRTFNKIAIERNIVYEVEDSWDITGFGMDDPEQMMLDVYYPANDTMKSRPLVVCLFGGAFVEGSKERRDMIAWCDSLAHYGYVAAAMNYRTGFNPFTTGNSFGSDEGVVRAIYRATQDCRAAVRFLKSRYQKYNIDTVQIYLLGNSAGAITSLNAAFMSEDERPAITRKIGFGSNNKDLGGLDYTGGFRHHPFKVAGVVSLWGASFDLNLIDKEENVPILLIHGTADEIVPYDQAYALNFSYGKNLNIFLYGSKAIKKRCDEQNMKSVLKPYESQPHCFYSCGNILVDELDYEKFPCEYWWPVFYDVIYFLGSINPYCKTSDLPDLSTSVDFKICASKNISAYKVDFTGNLLMNNSMLVYNAIGDVVYSQNITHSSFEFSLKNKPIGIYIVEIKNHAHSKTQKIMLK